MISSTDMTTASGFLSMLRERESCPSAPWLLLQPGSAPWSAELQFRTMGVAPQFALSPNESCALLFPAALGDQHLRKAGCELQRRAGVSPAPVGLYLFSVPNPNAAGARPLGRFSFGTVPRPWHSEQTQGCPPWKRRERRAPFAYANATLNRYVGFADGDADL